jgi:adenylate cyclase
MAENPDGNRFCGQCATPLSGYTPRHLPPQALSPQGLQGERKIVTVLFCDVVESTRVARELGAEAMHELLARFFEVALACVHRYDGTVNQFLGDGFMALFGAPIAHEDHAVRACLAAVDLLSHLPDDRIAVRLGANSGAVVVGAIGDKLRLDYTAVGHTTNLASRIQQLAPPGALYVSETTRGLAAHHFEFKGLGEHPLKGVDEPTPVHQVVGALRYKTRFDFARERGLVPFVERVGELARMRALWKAAREGERQVVLLRGEAGVGKSRLLFQFGRDLEPDARLLEIRPAPFERGRSYASVAAMLRAHFALEEQVGEEVVEERLRTVLGHQRPLFMNALGVGDPEALRHLDEPQIERMTATALVDLLLDEARRQPLCLLIEDIDAADSLSRRIFGRVVRDLTGARLLVTFTARLLDPLAELEGVERMEVSALDEQATVRLAASFFGVEEVPPVLAGLIVEKTGGVPLYVEELLRDLEEKAAVVREGKTLRVSDGLAAISPPGALEDLLRARIDRLHPQARRLLQTASVIGTRFDVALLAEVGPPFSADALEGLVEQQILLVDQGLYAFRHALVRDVLYEGILQKTRAGCHALVASALERRGEVDPALIAHHFELAGEQQEAAYYLLRAGRMAAGRHRYEEALLHFERALEIGADRLEAHEGRGDSLYARASYELAIAGWSEALSLAARTERRLDLHRKMARAHWSRADTAAALQHLEEATRLAESALDGLEKAHLYEELGRVACRLGRPREALREAERALALGEALREPAVISEAWNTIGVARARCGDLEGGVAALERSLDLARAHEQVAATLRACVNLSVLQATLDPERAESCYLEGLHLAREVGDLSSETWLLCTVASRACMRGADYERGVEAAEASIELDRRMGKMNHLPIPLILLAQIQQCHGNMEASERHYREALELARRIGEPQLLLPCLDGLAQIALLGGDEDGADRLLDEAREVERASGWSEETCLLLPFLC